MRERDAWEMELRQLEGFADHLELALQAEETEQGCDPARWGTFSHRWNRQQRDFLGGTRFCTATEPGHQIAHRAAGLLFPAWQKVHYTLTRGQPADRSGLEAIRKLLGDSRAALEAAREK